VVGVITEFVTKVLVKDTKDMVASLITGRNKTRRGQLRFWVELFGMILRLQNKLGCFSVV